MLKIEPYNVSITSAKQYRVVDDAAFTLGSLFTPCEALPYKQRLEEAGINSAEDLLAKVTDPARRAAMRSIMQPETI